MCLSRGKITFISGLFPLTLALSALLPENDRVPQFVDVTAESGIRFVHVNGEKSRKDYIPEAKGGGVGFFDFDNDGWLDLLLVQGSTLERYRRHVPSQAQLYQNRGDGRFEDVTERAGLMVSGWGMGVTFGDYDNDGFADVYITSLGPNILYRNNGNGTFTDVTAKAGVGDSRWSTSAAFGDYDRDGYLDLYVANYLALDFDNLPAPTCRHRESLVLCGPVGLPGAADVLYRNNGDGTFSDVSERTGVVDASRYYGLGVVWADLDNDGDPDLYVANDATPNLLFVNQGDGTFTESGFISGLAFNGDGIEQAGMGVDAEDYDNDGRLDLYVTHFEDDYSTLYHNEGELFFKDVTSRAGILHPDLPYVSWGTAFVDFDHDGWKDIFHANGHVFPYLIEAGRAEAFYQLDSLYINQADGTFADRGRVAGPGLQEKRAGRGAAFGDYDNDGDVDVIVANLNDSPRLLRNDRVDNYHWAMFKTAGNPSNRDGIGARVTVVTGKMTQIREIKRAKSIYSASDPRAHFGLGDSDLIDRLTVQWPSGKVQEFNNLPADSHFVVDENEGLRKELGSR